MIAIVKGNQHPAQASPNIDQNLVGFPDGIVISFDLTLDAAHALGFKVLPEVIVERRTTNQRRRLPIASRSTSSLLDKRRIARAAARSSP